MRCWISYVSFICFVMLFSHLWDRNWYPLGCIVFTWEKDTSHPLKKKRLKGEKRITLNLRWPSSPLTSAMSHKAEEKREGIPHSCWTASSWQAEVEVALLFLYDSAESHKAQWLRAGPTRWFKTYKQPASQCGCHPFPLCLLGAACNLASQLVEGKWNVLCPSTSWLVLEDSKMRVMNVSPIFPNGRQHPFFAKGQNKQFFSNDRIIQGWCGG